MNLALQRALKRKNQDGIINLLQTGIDPLKEGNEGKPFIFWIITLKLDKVFDYLAENFKATLIQKLGGKSSCLEVAIDLGSLDIAKKTMKLMMISPHINFQNSQGLPLLFQNSQGLTLLQLFIKEKEEKYKEKNLSVEERKSFILFLKQIFSLNPDLNLKDKSENTVKKIIEGNELASQAFDEYNDDMLKLKTYLLVQSQIHVGPENNKLPRELKLLIFSQFMLPPYVPTYQKQKYVMNLLFSDPQNTNQRSNSPR